MKLLSFLYVSILLIGTMSCKKEDLTYKIEGIVRDGNTKEVLSNTEVKLFRKDFSNSTVSDNYTDLGAVKTDINGKYFFETERIRVFEFKIEINDPKYYFRAQTIPSSQINSEETNVFNITMESRSWVALVINNPVVTTGEQINIFKQNFKTGCEECCSNGSDSYIEYGDTTLYCAAAGGTNVEITYGSVGGGQAINAILLCPPFDTVFYDINY